MTSNERRKHAAELHNKKRDENIAAREARRTQLEQIRAQLREDKKTVTPDVADSCAGSLSEVTSERPERKKVAVCGAGRRSSNAMLMCMAAMLASDSSVTRNVIDDETRNAYRKPRTIRKK